MRSGVIFIFFLIKCGVLLSSDDSEKVEFVPCGKTYIQCEQIDFLEDRIFVKIENSTICTSGIHTDELGYYFKDYRKEKNCEHGEWQCIGCKMCNPSWNTLCRKCSRPNWMKLDSFEF